MNKNRLRRLAAALCTLFLLPGLLPRVAAAQVDAPAAVLSYAVEPGAAAAFAADDFRAFFYARCRNDTFRCVVLSADDSLRASNGILYCGYGTEEEIAFTRNMLETTRFFDRSSMYGDYPLEGLSFVADRQAAGNAVTLNFEARGDTESCTGRVRLSIEGAAPSATGDASVVDLTWHVTAGDVLRFDRNDFRDFFRDRASESEKDAFRYLTFQTDASFNRDNGRLYYDFEGNNQKEFAANTLGDAAFFYSSSRYGSYPISGLTFLAANEGGGRLVRMPFEAFGRTEHFAGVLVIQIDWAKTGNAADTTPVYGPPAPATPPSVTETPATTETPSATETPATTETPSATETPTTTETPSATETPATTETPSTTEEPEAAQNPPATKEPEEPQEPEEPSGTAEEPRPVQPEKPAPMNITEPFEGTPVAAGNILYATTWNAALRLVSDDFDRFFRKSFPGGTLSHVNLTGLPPLGTLFYDFYASSPYGDADRLALQADGLAYMNFYFSPAYEDRYSLAELTYVPAAEKNLCETVPFSATGVDKDGNVVQCTGNIIISVTKAPIADVYGAIPKGRTVTFPADNLLKNVKDGLGADPDGFRFLQLPELSAGSVIVGENQPDAPAANLEETYRWGDVEPKIPKIADLRFVPAPDYTGSVDIPYVALDGDGNALGIGHFTLGVISTLKRFSDVSASVWCYKYVTELAAAGVVGGYGDDTYRPEISVTWGAALKLIMLAAGYDEQPGNSMTPFQGYLDKALEDGLLPKEIDLWEPVSRLEVAELAAAAMKLDTDRLSSVQPFSDTDNLSVRALNAAGIINGYYEAGESTFRPSGTLNRGQAAAIVWRMRNYQG